MFEWLTDQPMVKALAKVRDRINDFGRSLIDLNKAAGDEFSKTVGPAATEFTREIKALAAKAASVLKQKTGPDRFTGNSETETDQDQSATNIHEHAEEEI